MSLSKKGRTAERPTTPISCRGAHPAASCSRATGTVSPREYMARHGILPEWADLDLLRRLEEANA